MEFRHEWKHTINFSDLLTIRARLGAVARPDGHAAGGKYWVRSLYFDDPTDRALREKINGVNRREKFRIRYYNRDQSFIHLEKKSKQNSLCAKESAPVTAAEVRALLEGDWSWMDRSGRDLVWELRRKMTDQFLRPKTIVDYTREAYVYAPGNVRVTLDYDIRTALSPGGFLDPDCVTVPAHEAPIILEVKWDEFLPDPIRAAVQLPNRQASAFSKYAACRVYG